jgi:hypothetical protein
MRSRARCFNEVKAYVDDLPIVDCHDHSGACLATAGDPLAYIAGNFYLNNDLISASSEGDVATMLDTAQPLEARWPVFEGAWKRTCYTGYARAVRMALARWCGVTEITLDGLRGYAPPDTTDPAVFDGILDDAKIAARVLDVWPDPRQVIAGTQAVTPRGRLAINLVNYHRVLNAEAIQANAAPLGRTVTCLDEYLDACRDIFAAYKAFGAVAFKDQSAYTRSLAYGNPTRAEAEAVFNALLADPRRQAGYPDALQPLDDYLFHAFLRMARDLAMPVQLHTGHMAGVRNEITKANAIHLTPVFELHRDVRFDLFHANWPYSGEILFLVKNYPNVTLDFCWTHVIDPEYARNLFRQALSSVPHGKVHGYGSDYGGDYVTCAWAHAAIARENLAMVLADLVEEDFFALDDAKEVARMWLYENAKGFFRL